MQHLESTFKGKNSFWRYAVVVASVFLATNTIGVLPFLTGMFLKSLSDPGIYSTFAAHSNDYSVTGFSLNTLLVMMLFPFIAGLAALIILVRPLHSRTIRTVMNGTTGIRWKRSFISFAVWLGLSALYFLFYLKLDPQNFSINNRSASLIVLVVISIALIPFQAGFEEILFRGYLMQGFTALLQFRWFPLVMTSLLFGLMHSLNPEVRAYGFFTMMPQYIIFGLIFGIITILDDGVEAAIGAHAANNIFLCVMVTSKSSALQTAALFQQQRIYPWTELAALFVTGIIFILILARIFKWKDFRVLYDTVRKPQKSNPVN